MPTPQTSPAKAAAGGLAAGLAVAATLIAPFEGDRTHAYLDSVHIATICRGIITYSDGTRVQMGDVRTAQQCIDLNADAVKAKVAQMQPCLNVPVSPKTAGAMISFGYNVGARAYCKSVAVDFNAGRPLQGCQRMSLYHFAGGRSIPGLVRRRAAEQALCVEGLS